MEMLPEQQRALDYLARKGTRAPLADLRAQLRDAFDAAERAFDEVAADLRERAPAAGKWSPHEILDHLVLSHEPPIAQLASLLDGVDAAGGAIPADLHRVERPPWDAVRAQLGEVHAELRRLADRGSDDTLHTRVPVVMVIKIDSKPTQWIEMLDWKAFVQGIRVHTLEHVSQLKRTITA